MRNISDTISRLGALRARQGIAGHAAGRDRLSDLTGFGSNPGALRARTFVPDRLPRGASLVVVLHGCTQTAAGYDHGSGWSQLAEQEGFAVLFPEQQRANNGNLCFNWFVPGDTRRDGGEAQSIRQMIEAMVVAHGLDRERVFITGLSAGGAMASAMLASHPEVFASGAIVAGLPYGAANSVPEAFDRMRGHGGPSEVELQRLLRGASRHDGPWPSISVWHGSADQTVAATNADAIVAQWRAAHGLADRPDRTETVDGHARHVWIDAQGHERVEAYRVTGMGHGTPLHTAGETGLGKAGPFMLDVGISSTRHIARFWGLVGQEADVRPASRSADGKPIEVEFRRMTARPAETSGERPRAARVDMPQEKRADAHPAAVDVKKVIEDALRAAGLMR